jgi:hypothetical protein
MNKKLRELNARFYSLKVGLDTNVICYANENKEIDSKALQRSPFAQGSKNSVS